MPGTPVKIGPFTGGLNSYSGPTSIGDAEVVDIQNFDIDLDGSLYSRAPITEVDSGPAGVNGRLLPLGWYVASTGTRYFFAAFDTDGETWYRNDTTGVWTKITNYAATCVEQYADKLWIVPPPTSALDGGKWDPVGGYVGVPAIPKGNTCCIYKERLFVAGVTGQPNRVYFSNPADFGTFNTGVNFFDAQVGDGQKITRLYTFQNSVGIFKDDSTYVFSYDSDPARGNVRLIDGAIGLTNKNCLVEYDASLYIHHEDSVYQVTNWNFTLVNLKVPFRYTNMWTTYAVNEPSISLMSDRLVVNHFDTIYVFHLRTGIWTKWAVTEATLFNWFVEVPRVSGSEPLRYYGGSRQPDNTQTNRSLFEWRPIHDPVRTEEMTAFVVTKAFDFNVPYTFKRLFWWGIDMVAYRDIHYFIHPVAYSPSVSWDELSAYTWDQIKANGGTWDRPLAISLDIEDAVNISNTSGYRFFARFPKSLRFRQIYFTVEVNTNGSTTEGPARIYSLVAMVDNRQLAGKQFN